MVYILPEKGRKIMKKIYLFLAGLGVVGLLVLSGSQPVSMAAGGVKVGMVDFQRAINETNAGKKAEKDLSVSVEEKKKKFDILKNELETMRQDFEKQRLVLSGKPLDEKRENLQNKLMEVEKIGATYEQDLGKQKTESLKNIVTGLQQVVGEIGKKDGYDFIFERSQGGVLFTSGSQDITEQVIKEYNKLHQ